MSIVKFHLRYFITILFAICIIKASQAVSFDCSKATMQSEKLVCNNQTLSKLDDQMFAEYSKVKAMSANPDLIKNEQITWIKNVRDCGINESCIEDLYNKRISQLVAITVLKTGPSNTNTLPTPATSNQTNNVSVPPNSEQNTSTQQSPVTNNQTDTVTNTSKSEQSTITLPPPELNQEIITKQSASDSAIKDLSIQLNNESTGTPDNRLKSSSALFIYYGIGIFLYGLGFFIHLKHPKFRSFAIPTPFDLGCDIEYSEAELATKSTKQLNEFLFLIVSFIIFWGLL
jgi:uncharacterized protein